MVKIEGFFLILSLALSFYSFVDCAMRDETQIRKLPKWGWLLIIFFFGTIGSLSYLFIGRNGPRQPRIKRGKPRILPPDDNPDFLRGI
ncbi:unannotated protein [freshwater metagenome]|uniref:Unannotated protein n=1 Tax=freshwater metagenome TaxID=449393 RepID=A0A6J7EDA5_9ZZZZ|nr:hypothetical protein [Actinomycetota bacterium]